MALQCVAAAALKEPMTKFRNTYIAGIQLGQQDVSQGHEISAILRHVEV